MAHRGTGRIDRFAQMSKQEEIIAKKRQELLEKQRTTQLAKAVAAAQTLAAKIKSANGTGDSDNITASTVASESEASEEPVPVPVDQDDKKEIKVKPKEDPEPTKTLNSFTGKTGKFSFGIKRSQAPLPVTEQPPPKVINTFCNDGSFLENFKKILEKHEQPKPPPISVVVEATAAETATTNATPGTQSSDEPSADVTSTTTTVTTATEVAVQQQLTQHTTQQNININTAMQFQQHQQHQHQHQQHHHQHQQHQQHQQQQQHQAHLTLPPPPSVTNVSPAQQFVYNPNFATAPVPPPPMPTHHHHAIPAAFFTTAPQLVPPPPPPTTTMIMPMQHAVVAAPPPPPPPPQIPITTLANLAPLYMIPAPEPLQLNAIPQPKEFDLNAIPKPQFNLEAIQVPATEQQQQQMQQHEQEQHQHQQHQQQQQQHQQQQQQQQHQQPVFSDNNDHNCIQLPTTIENVIDLVAENDDDYEDQIRSHKNQLHPAMWFLFDKNCEQYHKYRQQLNERRRLYTQLKQQQQQQQLHEQEHEHVDEDDDEDEYEPEHEHEQEHEQEYEHEHEDEDEQQEQQQLQQHYQEQPHQQQQQLQDQQGLLEEDQEQSPQEQPQHKTFFAQQSPSTTTTTTAAADKYDPESVISGDVDSDDEYMRGRMDRNRDNLRRRIECRNELSEEERQEREAEIELEEKRRLEKKKLRKSRWGEKVAAENIDKVMSTSSGVGSTFGNQNKPLLSAIKRSDPALLQYARLNYGSTDLSEEDWKKCEEHYKINLLYQDMMRKREEIDRLARSGKFKYEYDSDEDVDGGTWEHKMRTAEMEATRAWAHALTKQSEGKHHIGDFLPPEELKKFMEQYEAKKNNRQPDLSDYKEYKLKEDNIGFQMLQKLGWKEGQGLGTDGAGIVDPVNKAPQRDGNQGLGVSSAATPENCDNEYDAYRKRMMLAYRFRPNPLNNPRRAYY